MDDMRGGVFGSEDRGGNVFVGGVYYLLFKI